MHWADVEANTLLKKGRVHTISTGITPSGTLHVGTLREAITAEAVRKALSKLEANVRMIYLVDSFDPLRKRYPFLPEWYEAEVGKPISYIPCPCGEHRSYAQHFIQPFLDSIDELGIHCQVYWTHEQYEQGRFAEVIDTTIKNKEKVQAILREVSGRDLPADFFPYNPRCGACGRIVQAKIESYEFPYVTYRCGCGNEGKADVRKADGKLPWRIEWAAKWKIFGVTCEPFGKDHAAAGGSYDTGVRLAREVFDIDPPHPIPYEFVQLKGKGQMHKSTGTSVTGVDALRITPARVLNYSMLRCQPDRHIDYDSGLGVLDMVDEYDRVERMFYCGCSEERDLDLLRAYELAQPEGAQSQIPLQIPYRHLVSLVQLTDSFEIVLETLKRTEHIRDISPGDLAALKERVDCVRYWLKGFAPEEVKFCICQTMPQVELTEQERTFLKSLLSAITEVPWEGERIHDTVYETAKAQEMAAKTAFQTLYKIFINKRSGPRLGYFLSTLDRDFVVQRIGEAAQ